MRRFNTIIESANPPGRNQLWIDHKKLRYFTENRWELLGGGDIKPPEISDHDTWIIEGVDTGKPSRGEKGQTGEAGPTPLFRTTDTAVEYSYDGIEWEELVPLTDFQIHNNPDEEDITTVDGKLKLKDKAYLASQFSGLGRVYLRKNIQGGKNILTQEMINAENTLYCIQYDYDLNGATITIPNNSMLYFFGGSLKNGTLSLPFSPTVLEGRVKMTQVTVNYTAGNYSLNDNNTLCLNCLDLPSHLSKYNLPTDGVTDCAPYLNGLFEELAKNNYNNQRRNIIVIIPEITKGLVAKNTIECRCKYVEVRLSSNIRFDFSDIVLTDDSSVTRHCFYFNGGVIKFVGMPNAGVYPTIDGGIDTVQGIKEANASANFHSNTVYIIGQISAELQGVKVTNGFNNVQVASPNNVQVNNVYSTLAKYDNGIHVSAIESSSGKITARAIVSNCLVEGAKDIGIDVSTPSAIVQNCVCRNCGNNDGYNAGGGFGVEFLQTVPEVINIMFLNCTAKDCNNYGFYTACGGITYNGCTVDGVVATTSAYPNNVYQLRTGTAFLNEGKEKLNADTLIRVDNCNIKGAQHVVHLRESKASANIYNSICNTVNFALAESDTNKVYLSEDSSATYQTLYLTSFNNNGIAYKKCILWIPKGISLDRPSSPEVGMQFFDTTIGKPVWWTGTQWMEASSGSTGAAGNSTRVMYAKTSSPSVTPVVISDNINPGSIWGTAIPSRTSTEAIWGIQASVTADNQLASPWEGPYLMTGINGEDGKDGADGTDGKDGKDAVTPNWYTYVFKLSDDKPSGPNSNDPNNPGNGWLDYPNANGNWWQCIGTVNGVTGKVTEWSEVIPLNGRDGQDGQDGQDGTAQDGRYTEFRFAKTTGSTPSLNKTLRDPSGWTVAFPTISEGEILWMIKAVINPDDTLYTNWDGPIRISGERGPQGNTGPAGKDGATGSQGIAGIPGVDIEWRFSLGTETSYDATYNSTVRATRDPSSYGWLLTQPDITGDKPYIWLIQARIIHAVNTDEGHLDSNGWQTPIRLNGVNGLDGANGPAGKKGQLIYPAGVYGNTVSYTTDEYKAPYVLDPSDGNFYVLNSIMTWVGTQQNNKTPSQSYQEDGGKYWLKFEAFEAIYAKIGVIANGLIGSAVFNGNYMFSQQGTDASGNPSSNYESFTGGEDSPFKPNLLIDFNTGDITYKGVSQVLSYQMTDNETLTITNKFPYNKIITAKNCTLKFALNDSYIPRTIEVGGSAIYNYATTGMFVNGGNLDKTLSYVELGTSTITYPAGEYYINNYSIPRVINNTMNGFLGQFSIVANNMVGVMSASTIFGQQNIGQLIWSQQGTGGTFTLDDDERRKIYPYDLTFSIPRLSATGLDYVGGKWWSVSAQLIVTNNTSGDKKIVSLVVQYPSDITGLSGSNSVSFTGLMLQ